MRFLRRSLVGLFLIALTVGLLSYAGHMVTSAIQARLDKAPVAQASRERVFSVNVRTLAPETLTPVLSGFGEIRARRSLELRTQAGGTVVALHPDFEEGGAVAAGELILQVDPSNAQWALDVARADLSQAEANLRDAERKRELAAEERAATEDQARLQRQTLTRQRDLRARGVGTDAAVEAAELSAAAGNQAVVSRRQAEAQAEAEVARARTELERARIALDEAERALADTELRAAFSGKLSDVSLVEGALVAANERVADLIDPDALEVAFRVSTVQYTRLLDENGVLRPLPVTAVLDVFGADLEVRGRITRASAAVAEGQVGRLLFARLDPAPGFRPGDFVTVRVEEPPLSGVARLPATAVNAAGEVLVLAAEDRLEAVSVEVLRRQDDDVIVRAPGIYGRDVVLERSPLLGAGIRVRPIRPGAEEASAGTEAEEMLELTPERRAALIALVEANPMMPEEAKARVRAQLEQARVPARMVERIESRMGG